MLKVAACKNLKLLEKKKALTRVIAILHFRRVIIGKDLIVIIQLKKYLGCLA